MDALVHSETAAEQEMTRLCGVCALYASRFVVAAAAVQAEAHTTRLFLRDLGAWVSRLLEPGLPARLAVLKKDFLAKKKALDSAKEELDVLKVRRGHQTHSGDTQALKVVLNTCGSTCPA